jgi:peroxiredoxin
MPDIERLRQDFPDLVVLAANVGDSPADAEKFIQNNDYGFMWTIDKTGDIAQAYPSDGIPYTVIIDKQGNVHEIFLGSPPDAYGTYRKSLSQLM